MNLNLNINDNDNDYLLIYDMFGKSPNRIVVNGSFETTEFIKIIDGCKVISKTIEINSSSNDVNINEKRLVSISDTIICSYFIVNKDSDEEMIRDISLLYKDILDEDNVNLIIQKLVEISYIEDEGKFNIISINSNLLTISPISIQLDSIELDEYYNGKVIKDSKNFIKSIKESNIGLSILCGEKGVGKTSLIKHICSEVDKKCIFIPLNMVDLTINNPEFINVIINNLQDSILIIDDCETLSKYSHFINNILQLVDGFISESLNINIVLLYNSSIDDINEYLLESNSILNIIEIDKLNKKKATNLSTKFGNNQKYKSSMSIGDVIYNKKNNSSISL